MLQRLADIGGLAQTVITESQSLASDLASYVTTGTGRKYFDTNSQKHVSK